jgi:threonyl-tRNA synthetase
VRSGASSSSGALRRLDIQEPTMADHSRDDLNVDQLELDHRDVNLDLGVFATDPLVGAGLPLWLPAGAVIRQELEALARQIAAWDGCQPVYSPVLAKRALFERSGHWAKFRDDMFPPMPVGGEELVLRPANCPITP